MKYDEIKESQLEAINQINKLLEVTDEDEKMWNSDRHVYELAKIILGNVNTVARKYDIDKRSPTYEAYLTKQLDRIEMLLRNNIAHIRSSDDAFSGNG